jgi:hypothetical protein
MTILPNYDNATPERGAFLPLTGRLAITLGACRSRLRGDLLPGRWSIFRSAARLWGSGVSPVCLWVSPPAALALARRSRSFLGTRVPVAGRFSAESPLSEIGVLAGLSAVPALGASAAVRSVWLCSERPAVLVLWCRVRFCGAGRAPGSCAPSRALCPSHHRQFRHSPLAPVFDRCRGGRFGRGPASALCVRRSAHVP